MTRGDLIPFIPYIAPRPSLSLVVREEWIISRRDHPLDSYYKWGREILDHTRTTSIYL